MRRIALIIGVLAWLLAGRATGQAAPTPDLVDRITSIRLILERIEDARMEVQTQRDAMARRHEQMASEIKRLKSSSDSGDLLPDFRLQKLLRRSQELSASLTLLNRELEALKQSRNDRLEQLVLAYDKLVEQTARQVRSVEGQRRIDLLGVLASARKEREAVRRLLMPGAQAPRAMDADWLLASEDPEELSERADAVRDEQDRLRRDLARLDRRIAELKSDRRLDQEMHDFITDQEIFNEGSRILVLPRNSTTNNPPSTEAPPDSTRVDKQDGIEGGGNEHDLDDEDPAVSYDGAPGEGGFWGEPEAPADEPMPGPEVGPDSRLPVGLDKDAGQAASIGSLDGPRALKQRRKEIVERLKKLQIIHDHLQEKIEDLSRE